VTVDTITCAHCADLVPAYVADELANGDVARLVEHVRGCADCRLRLHQALNEQGHIACREVVDLVSDYLEGTLTEEQRIAVERHLAICPPCRVYVDQIRQTVALLGTLPEETLDEGVKTDLLAAFRHWKHP